MLTNERSAYRPNKKTTKLFTYRHITLPRGAFQRRHLINLMLQQRALDITTAELINDKCEQKIQNYTYDQRAKELTLLQIPLNSGKKLSHERQ